MVAALINISTKSVEGFPFSKILSKIFYFLSLMIPILIAVTLWDITIVVLICISLTISDAELFIMCDTSLYVFSGRVSFQILYPDLHQLLWVFILSFMSSLYILILILIKCIIWQIFSHLVGCLFILLILFSVWKLFSLNGSSPFFFFFLLLLLFWHLGIKNHHQDLKQ